MPLPDPHRTPQRKAIVARAKSEPSAASALRFGLLQSEVDWLKAAALVASTVLWIQLNLNGWSGNLISTVCWIVASWLLFCVVLDAATIPGILRRPDPAPVPPDLDQPQKP